MPVLNYSIVATEDDGYINRADAGYFYHDGDISMGVNTYTRMAFLRFVDINIPLGSSVATAVLTIQAAANEVSAAVVRVYCRLVANADQPSTYAGTNGYAKTTAYAEWVCPSFTDGSNYSIDIAAPVQEVIDLATWVALNDIVVLIDTVPTSGALYRTFKDFVEVPATLSITYTDNSTYFDITVPRMTVTGTAFETPANAMRLPVPVVDAFGTPGANAECTLPKLTLSSNIFTVAQSASTLPVLTVAATGYNPIIGACTFPKLTVVASGKLQLPSNIILPKLTASATASSILKATSASILPRITVTATAAVVDATNKTSLTLPVITVAATVKELGLANATAILPVPVMNAAVGVHANAAATFTVATVSATTGQPVTITLPSLTFNALAVNGNYGNADTDIPLATVEATAVVGELGAGAVILSRLVVSGTGYDVPVGAGALILPAMTLRSTAQFSDRFASTVLKYARPT